ncbi:hypothetical protein [Trabulsiella guamensis]|uniref:hypothetical protein n=1 Tax=Trabulsiella guamensis TaxID=158852 RepID=UPI000A029126|nr:hypothetical protein [Trabulsiella guamensis]
MKKRYSQHGSYAGSVVVPTYAPVQASKNTYVYRGFTIRKTPRNALNDRITYLITRRDHGSEEDIYYGRDFALAEACKTIDRVLRYGRF